MVRCRVGRVTNAAVSRRRTAMRKAWQAQIERVGEAGAAAASVPSGTPLARETERTAGSGAARGAGVGRSLESVVRVSE